MWFLSDIFDWFFLNCNLCTYITLSIFILHHEGKSCHWGVSAVIIHIIIRVDQWWEHMILSAACSTRGHQWDHWSWVSQMDLTVLLILLILLLRLRRCITLSFDLLEKMSKYRRLNKIFIKFYFLPLRKKGCLKQCSLLDLLVLWKSYIFSYLMKDEKLLCLKNLGRIVSENSFYFLTTKDSPSGDQATIESYFLSYKQA